MTIIDKRFFPEFNGSGFHNSVYRGKDLGTLSSSIINNIADGSFLGIFPGDFFSFDNLVYSYEDENGDTQSASFSGTFRIADCDYFLNCGDTALKTHHCVVVPDTALFSAPMNETDTTENGYSGSKMRTFYLKRALAIFEAAFGAEHILSHREVLVNAVSNDTPSDGTFFDCKVELLNEPMVYGAPFALFRFRHDLIVSNQVWFWLRDVISATMFARVNSNGDIFANNASYSNGGVRPYALIY